METDVYSYSALSYQEGRRLRACELAAAGWKQSLIAQALGVTEGAVSQWLSRARQQGIEALKRRPCGGHKPRLSAAQQEELKGLLKQGADQFSFSGAHWTGKRAAHLIEQKFGVHYNYRYVITLLHKLGFSPQKPETRATQRNEEAITEWRDQEWPRQKRGHNAREDRSCFSMKPASIHSQPS